MNQKQRDLLCKMLETEADKINGEINEKFPLSKRCLGGWYVHSDKDRIAKLTKHMSKDDQDEFAALMEETKALREKQDALDKAWRRWFDDTQHYLLAQGGVVRQAKQKLRQHVDSKIIEIQFATNADEAKTILGGLPTAEDLIAPSGDSA